MEKASDSILLVPGESIAIWPEVKLGRAYSHMMSLQQKIEEWESLRPLRTRAIQVASNKMWVMLEVVVPPPTQALAAVFGDAVHNLRSSLDALVWEVANFDGNGPVGDRAQRAVQFPLYSDPQSFRDWAASVGSVRPELLARLEQQQPYMHAETLAAEGKFDTLIALHKLDVQDKHRNAIEARTSVDDLSAMEIGIRGDIQKLRFLPRERAELVDGAVLIEVESSEGFELLEFRGGPVSAHFDIPFRNGFAPLLELLSVMSGKVRATLDAVYGTFSISPDDVEDVIEVQFSAGNTTTSDGT